MFQKIEDKAEHNLRKATETIVALDTAIEMVDMLGKLCYSNTGINEYVEDAGRNMTEMANMVRKIADDFEIDLTETIGWS